MERKSVVGRCLNRTVELAVGDQLKHFGERKVRVVVKTESSEVKSENRSQTLGVIDQGLVECGSVLVVNTESEIADSDF